MAARPTHGSQKQFHLIAIDLTEKKATMTTLNQQSGASPNHHHRVSSSSPANHHRHGETVFHDEKKEAESSDGKRCSKHCGVHSSELRISVALSYKSHVVAASV